MSVSNQSREQLRTLCSQTKDLVAQQLQLYGALLSQFATQINNSFAALHASRSSELLQLENLRLENIQLRSTLAGTQTLAADLDRQSSQLKLEQAQKEALVQQLNSEVESLRASLRQLQLSKHEQAVVDFDEPEPSYFSQLQTIKEVSQHDLSASMSLESIRSYLQEDSTPKKINEESPLGPLPASQTFTIDNYKDALQILKSFSTGEGPMIRKSRVCDSGAKENRPCGDTNRPKVAKNGTIAKIKKMRRIQSLQLETGYVVKSERAPLGLKNQVINSDSKLEEGKSLLVVDHTSAHSSTTSTHMKSQEIISLDEPLRRLNEIIDKLNAEVSGTSQFQVLSSSVCKINYPNRLQYHGGFDTHQQPSGYGKLLVNGQVVYQGEWRTGKMHGWGKLVVLPFLREHEREILEVDGNFRGGHPDGTVVCLFSSGQKFMGSVRRGRIQNEGTFVSERGILTGHWQASCLVLLI